MQNFWNLQISDYDSQYPYNLLFINFTLCKNVKRRGEKRRKRKNGLKIN